MHEIEEEAQGIANFELAVVVGVERIETGRRFGRQKECREHLDGVTEIRTATIVDVPPQEGRRLENAKSNTLSREPGHPL